jgi:hypothetical protein
VENATNKLLWLLDRAESVVSPFGEFVGLFLKKLEIHGFKSFADKTELLLSGDHGGRGPERLRQDQRLDSLRWVLGNNPRRACAPPT